MSPEEMMKPKNDCQRRRREGEREQQKKKKRKMAGRKRTTDCFSELSANERMKGRYLEV